MSDDLSYINKEPFPYHILANSLSFSTLSFAQVGVLMIHLMDFWANHCVIPEGPIVWRPTGINKSLKRLPYMLKDKVDPEPYRRALAEEYKKLMSRKSAIKRAKAKVKLNKLTEASERPFTPAEAQPIKLESRPLFVPPKTKRVFTKQT
jgi:hypothetical protein